MGIPNYTRDAFCALRLEKLYGSNYHEKLQSDSETGENILDSVKSVSYSLFHFKF